MAILTQRQAFLPAIEVVGMGFSQNPGSGPFSIGFSNSSISSWVARYAGTVYGVWGSVISTAAGGTCSFSVGNKSTSTFGSYTTAVSVGTTWGHAESSNMTLAFSANQFLYPAVNCNGTSGTVSVQVWFVVRPN